MPSLVPRVLDLLPHRGGGVREDHRVPAGQGDRVVLSHLFRYFALIGLFYDVTGDIKTQLKAPKVSYQGHFSSSTVTL